MATFHNMTNRDGKPVVRAYVKGAPDVLISRGSSFWTAEDGEVAVGEQHRQRALSENDRLAGSGQRVMIVAQRDFDPATFDPGASLIDSMEDLTLLAMVGIVDPPRPEAKAAIEECKSAGIRVRMITGDHATTAAAIGEELGIHGKAMTGAQFAAMTDEALLDDMDNIGVIARVAPEDKIRLVRLLQESGEIVAMTGDGVNDAPALKKADIGVAMGITGTEVSKGAAVMILTDDNFSTIVNAVEYGRSLYDNLIKYLRFQMVCLITFIAIFVGATLLNIAAGRPLNPVQILWLNFAIDVPLAIALGFDTPTPGLMLRKPRRANAPVFNRSEWIRLAADGAVMTIGVLALYEYMEDGHGVAVAATMLLTTLTLFHIVMGLCARNVHESVFSRDAIPDWSGARFYLLAVVLTVIATEIGFLQRALDTVSLNVNQWLVCGGVALTLLLLEEAIKLYERRKAPKVEAGVAPQNLALETETV
jgi:Ca2+-transporting ATPase